MLPLLLSCSEKDTRLTTGSKFLSPNEMKGSFTTGNVKIPLTVKVHPDSSIEVFTDSPDGYSIVFSKDSSRVKFNSLELEGDFSLSLFTPIYTMFSDIKKADFSRPEKADDKKLLKLSENGTTLFFSKKTRLPERIEKDSAVFIFEDFS